jgi:diacylglycerol kinase family enzyme
MRAAAILGLGSSAKAQQLFQKNSAATWLIGLPASSNEADVILIFGGDGTVHRHLPQLVKLQLPVLVVPCGSGNDFARALNLGSVKDSLAAWHKFSSGGGNVRTIDLGVIMPWGPDPQGLKPQFQEEPLRSAEALRHPNPQRLNSFPSPSETGESPAAAKAGPSQNKFAARLKPCPDTPPQPHQVGDAATYSAPGAHHYFCCVGGVGLDGDIARRANRLPRWVRGHGGYVVSLLPALLRFAPLPMKISAAENSRADQFAVRSETPTVLAAFANTPAYGGGMRIAPDARFDDGQLDICIVSDVDKFKLFCLFPTVYFGRHLSIPEVEYFRAERLRVETEKPLDVYADGEYICVTPIEVSVAANALRVLVP